jgi:hypothetical protein
MKNITHFKKCGKIIFIHYTYTKIINVVFGAQTLPKMQKFYILRTNTPEDIVEVLKPHKSNPVAASRLPACLPPQPHFLLNVSFLYRSIAKFREVQTFSEIVT